jgi:hypothetical protein
MKKLLVLLAALLLVAVAVPAAFAEVELGISATPVPGGQSNSGGTDMITGFHVGYNWGILYGSWDALAMPAQLISNMTGYWDPVNNIYVDGPYVPGFLNLYDIGLRLMLQPFVIYTEVGANSIYVYKNLGGGGSFGANLRLGAGLRFGFWGVNLSGTAVFGSFEILGQTLKKLVSDQTRNEAVSTIGQNLVPSINLTFYF